MIKITRLSLPLVYSITCDYQSHSWIKVVSVVSCKLYMWLIMRLIYDIRRGNEEVGPLECQIFSVHVKHCRSTVEHSLQQSRNKKHNGDR